MVPLTISILEFHAILNVHTEMKLAVYVDFPYGWSTAAQLCNWTTHCISGRPVAQLGSSKTMLMPLCLHGNANAWVHDYRESFVFKVPYHCTSATALEQATKPSPHLSWSQWTINHKVYAVIVLVVYCILHLRWFCYVYLSNRTIRMGRLHNWFPLCNRSPCWITGVWLRNWQMWVSVRNIYTPLSMVYSCIGAILAHQLASFKGRG